MKNLITRFGLVLALCFFSLQGWAQIETYRLSPEAKISLITCSSGSDLYAIFGHSAVRVNDPATGMDIVFNYGTFDFDEPNFYLKFIRGKLKYKLSISDFDRFKYSYTMDNRSVYEQEMNFTEAQKQQYWGFLTNNYLPANRFYLYDFFFDNCATRIRDGVEASFPDQIRFNISDFDKDMSFRNLIDLYLIPQPWSDFGIDFALGARIDQEAAPYEYMFLPDYLSQGFEQATISQDGQTKPLVGPVQVLFEREPIPFTAGLFTPALIWWVFFVAVLALTVIDWKKHRRSSVFDMVFFFIVGLMGVVLLLLWFATDHQATAYNFNLLWALPTHAVAAFFLGRRVLPEWVGKYLLATVAIAAVLLVFWPWWPQMLHTAFIPVALALALRAAYAAWLSKKSVPAHITPQVEQTT
ncbi:Lnb N-terminal periplasmic domain-containing protein [Pontibacter sp. CAU 1760]